MSQPEHKQDPMYQLLKHGQVDEFNQRRGAGEACNLVDADLRSQASL